jgi:4-alpha-glucanotransferase
MQKKRDAHRLLRTAARLAGVAASYINCAKQRVYADDAALTHAIRALYPEAALPESPDVQALDDFIVALRLRRRLDGLPPLLTAWDGHLRAWAWVDPSAASFTATLRPEDKKQKPVTWTQAIAASRSIRRGGFLRVRLACDHEIPFGYYDLEIETGTGASYKSFLIAAPSKAGARRKDWGAFAPAYALRADDTSIGDYGALRRAAALIGQSGGAFIGTLPLLATYYEGPRANISPYVPVSRLFWNEIYLDTSAPPFPPGANGGGDDGGELVDYGSAYAEKKRLIARAAAAFFEKHPEGDDSFRAYAAANPALDAYAAFRAKGAENEHAAKNFHLFAQYACHVQMQAVDDADNAALYIDYPVGVHPEGFDALYYEGTFLNGYNAGAPPDMFFGGGQDWGFRPLNPRILAQNRLSYIRDSIRHFFRAARMVRVDHIMGLYRMYCIPRGAAATEGVYLYYPFDSLLAVLCLEAHRHVGTFIGEDLGTVPDIVRDRMQNHGINGMWIMPFEMRATPVKTFAAIKPDSIAALNTHDMFPFAAFFKGSDLDVLRDLSILSAEDSEIMRADRARQLKSWRTEKDPFLAALGGLAASQAQHVIVNLEDIWSETLPQNIPGTVDAWPNWRRRHRETLDRLAANDRFNKTAALLNQHRRKQ